MSNITEKWLIEQHACQEGIIWFNGHAYKSQKDVLDQLIADNKHEWANWLIAHLLDNDQLVQYAIFAARQVLCHWDTEYPNDKRPLKAIEAAEEYLKLRTSAAGDAWDAAGDARAAAWAAALAAAGVSRSRSHSSRVFLPSAFRPNCKTAARR